MNLDAPDELPTRGGLVLDLRTRETRPRTPEDLFSFECPVSYVRGPRPLAERFFADVWPDDSVRAYMRLACGYFITGHVDDRGLQIWHGVGRNGKGALCTLLRAMLAGFYTQLDRSVLLAGQQSGAGAATPQLMALRTARLGVFSESKEGDELNETLVKALTGDDPISARQLYCKQTEFRARAKLVLQTNHRPKINVQDQAMIDRLRLIPFSSRFVDNPTKENERQADREFVETLKAGEGLDQVFSWMVDGAAEWYAAGRRLVVPQAIRVVQAAEFLGELDLVQRFLDEACERDGEAQSSTLYAAYQNWHGRNARGEPEPTQRAFTASIKRKGFKAVKRSCVYFEGLRLREADGYGAIEFA